MQFDNVYKYADYIINKAKKQNDEINIKQVQMILFYSYIEYLYTYSEVLFKENFKAWSNGPVIPEVYFKYININNKHLLPRDFKDDIRYDEQIILNNCYNLIINKNIDDIIDRTKYSINDNIRTPWEIYYTFDFDKKIYTNEDTIPLSELKRFYLNEQNYKNLRF